MDFSLRVRTFDSFEDYQTVYGKRSFFPFMLDASVPLEQAVRTVTDGPWTLLFGNEGTGLPPEFAGMGQPVRIPSNEKIDSLNLAVAAGIGIYAFMNS